MPSRHFFKLLFLVGTVLAGCTGSSRAADYGTKTTFKKAVPVTFPDFVLTYVGERKVASEKFPRGFVYHDFRIAAVPGTQTVSWSSGTGDIGPALFKVGGKNFALELSRSDKLGRLREDEVVISRAP
jgi:hypothetical protein